MKKVVTKSFAKINLSLDVLGKRENGYHDVCMVMETVSVFDQITVECIKSGIELSTNLPYLPLDQNNLAYKEQGWRNQISQFENLFQRCCIQDSGVTGIKHLYS